METEKYSPELVNKYLNLLKKEYPEKDSHFFRSCCFTIFIIRL